MEDVSEDDIEVKDDISNWSRGKLSENGLRRRRLLLLALSLAGRHAGHVLAAALVVTGSALGLSESPWTVDGGLGGGVDSDGLGHGED